PTPSKSSRPSVPANRRDARCIEFAALTDFPGGRAIRTRGDSGMIGSVKRYRFTVDQYHRMGKARIFSPDCRVELVNGEIFEMSPIDPWHSGVVNWLTHRFITGLGGRAIVPVQNPTTVDPRSEPQ